MFSLEIANLIHYRITGIFSDFKLDSLCHFSGLLRKSINKKIDNFIMSKIFTIVKFNLTLNRTDIFDRGRSISEIVKEGFNFDHLKNIIESL